MFSQNVGGILELEMLLQQQLLLYLHEQEQGHEDQKAIVRGVSWLRDPLTEPKADYSGASSKADSWTCPRCRSHLCMRANPGNVSNPVYCCAVCGYTFHKASATCLSDTKS